MKLYDVLRATALVTGCAVQGQLDLMQCWVRPTPFQIPTGLQFSEIRMLKLLPQAMVCHARRERLVVLRAGCHCL